MYFYFAFVFFFNLIVGNDITGTIPSEIGMLTELTRLDLCKCSCQKNALVHFFVQFI